MATHAPSLASWVLASYAAALSLWVYWPALGRYFSPDDLILLERWRGLTPPIRSLWRFLSGRAYFDLTVPLFQMNPVPYLAVNVVLHCLNVVLVHMLARRLSGNAITAGLAAVLFGSSRLFFSLVGQVVGFGDLLSLGAMLTACIVLTSESSQRAWIAVPIALLAVLAKESVVLLPLSLVCFGERIRRKELILVLMVGGLWCFYLFFTGTFQTAFGGRAYEAGFGAHLFQNLMLYARWSVDLASVAPDAATFSLRSPWIAGIPFFAIGVVGAIAAYRATRLPACGIAWWVLGLLPVLPLLRHTYVNYLYAPSAGLAMAIASLGWWLLSGRWVRKHLDTQTGMAKGAAILACFALVMSLWSRHLIQRRVEEVLPNADMPRDTFVRKSELIRRVADRVATAVDSRACGIVFYIPAIEGTTQFLTDLLPTVLDDGRGLRALRPSVDSVAFIQEWSSAYDRFELFGGSVDGRVIHFGTGREAHIRLAKTLLGNGYVREAREYLESVLREYPGDQSLLRMYHEMGRDRGF